MRLHQSSVVELVDVSFTQHPLKYLMQNSRTITHIVLSNCIAVVFSVSLRIKLIAILVSSLLAFDFTVIIACSFTELKRLYQPINCFEIRVETVEYFLSNRLYECSKYSICRCYRYKIYTYVYTIASYTIPKSTTSECVIAEKNRQQKLHHS